LDPALCALPFPSSHFLVEDASTPTGLRLNFGPLTLPSNRDGVQTRPEGWNTRDGFSINSVAMAHFPGVTVDGLISSADIGAYADAAARTVILDATTGERVPHWAELDVTSPEPTAGDDQRLLLLRPERPYEWNRRYIVALRGLTTADGAAIAPSPAFAALRDGAASDLNDVELRRAHFDADVFPALEAAGFPRDELVLAWDFHTASRERTLGDLEYMRDDALAWAESNGLAYTLEVVEDRDCAVEGEHIARQIEGSFTSPYYTETDGPAQYLHRDADGRPAVKGTKEVDFIVRVPCSVANGADGSGATAASAPILQYGHGLLGSHGEVNSGYLAEMADRYGYVLYASGWTGFKAVDSPGIALMIALDPSDFAWIPEGSHQGMIEFALGMRLMSRVLKDDAALTFDGAKVIDPERRYYYGNSQGAILGSAYLGMSTDIERGVLGVGGGPYSLLLTRSTDFDTFFRLFKEKYTDFRDITLFVNGLTQQVWDPVEPGGWMWDLTRDTANPKGVLLQVAIGDNQVTTLGAHYQARALGARTVAPQTRPIWGVEEGVPPFDGPAIVEWLYTDGPTEPLLGVPPDAPDTHECPRRERAAQDQLRDFLATGTVVQHCDGVCEGLIAVTCR
jgi:hypothetical protein